MDSHGRCSCIRRWGLRHGSIHTPRAVGLVEGWGLGCGRKAGGSGGPIPNSGTIPIHKPDLSNYSRTWVLEGNSCKLVPRGADCCHAHHTHSPDIHPHHNPHHPNKPSPRRFFFAKSIYVRPLTCLNKKKMVSK